MSVSARELREPGRALEREFEAIYRREFPLALGFARRYLDDDAAEDVVQAVFMEYWEGYTQQPALVFGADATRTHAAILASVRNRMRSAMRRAKTIGRSLHHMQREISEVLRDAMAPERPQAEKELSEVVARALDSLPLRQREVFSLVKFDEMSYDETATVLGISQKTVHQHLVKANARLRHLLAEYNVPEPTWSYELYNEQVREGKKDAQP
jgi:RNA polymerase sigma-70 factor (ECF subfamily)